MMIRREYLKKLLRIDQGKFISEKEFENYKEGPGILTMGTPGS